IAQAVIVVVIVVVIAGDDDEAIAEVMISVVISTVERPAHLGAMKCVHPTVAEVRVSVSSRAIADYAAAGRSDADMSGSESSATTNAAPSEFAGASRTAAATHVSTAKSTTNVAAPASTATSKAATTNVAPS